MTMGYGVVGLIILALDIWGIINVIGSGASMGSKLLWILLIIVLPVVGLIFWFLAGRAAHGLSPERSHLARLTVVAFTGRVAIPLNESAAATPKINIAGACLNSRAERRNGEGAVNLRGELHVFD